MMSKTYLRNISWAFSCNFMILANIYLERPLTDTYNNPRYQKLLDGWQRL